MKTKAIQSEQPSEHWSDITDVQDKIVMDFGCGWLFNGSTTEYFLSRGAYKVIGIDASCGEIAQLTEQYPDHKFICKTIVEKEDISTYIKVYKPQVIKMDIEGLEHWIDQIPNEDFDSVEEVAIEYHNPQCKEILERRLTQMGFNIFAINSFGWFVLDPNIMGVLHAKR